MSWWTVAVPEWESDLFDGMAERINNFITTVKGRRGVICNLEKDWSVINIPLYIENKVPFFYLWDFEARSDSRFSHLNLALNMTYWAVRRGTAVHIPTDLKEEDLNKIARQAVKLDEFFQEVFLYTQPYDPPIFQSYSLFIIDFEGWKRRPIKYSDDTLASLSKLYYYTTIDDDEGSQYKTVLFWRWRKRQPTDEYLRCQYRPSLPGEDHAATMRKLHKFSYGPKAGILYDIETGLAVGRAKPQSKPLSLLQRISGVTERRETTLEDRLSDSFDKQGQEDMMIDDNADMDSTDEDFLCVCFEELSDQLYNPRAVNSPAAWIHHNEQKLEQARRQASIQWDARGDRPGMQRHSQSPSRLSDPYYITHERPEVMFR